MKIYNKLDSTKVILDYPSDSLVGADLRNADLNYANLYNADLHNADLYNADLRNANLHNANLHNADLRNADLSYADLNYANLRNADLRNADLRNADLHNAKLDNTVINWQSHDLLAEILRQNAVNDNDFALSGYILQRRDLCWEGFVQSTPCTVKDRLRAFKTLAKYITENDNHPEILDQYRSDV
ncbi:MAG TPA: pentapeptide repeat-containing protein [Aquella sp.]|nr:pentapeptide repeat-containing protein [Aquella sp.]